MQHILIKVEFNDLMDKEKLDYDLYNEKGEIVHKKGQKIDSGFLLMLKYVNLYKKDTSTVNPKRNVDEKQEIVEFTRELLLLGAKKRASDICIEPLENTILVRFFINGIIDEEINLDKSFHIPLILRLKKLANLDIDETEKYQEGNITISMFNRSVEFKFSCTPTPYGEKAILQIQEHKKTTILDLSELFLSSSNLHKLKIAIKERRGIFFVAGPAVSGKTTGAYSLLKHLKQSGMSIVTIEDPIKYQLPGIVQIHRNLANKKALDDVLLQIAEHKPDILMIKGIFDKEPVETALQFAMCSCFTLSTMHAKNSIHLIESLMAMNVNPNLLGNTIVGILSQRLVRRICDHCKEKYESSFKELDKIFILDKNEPIYFYRGAGCPHCDNTGFSGQIPIQEVIVLNDDLRRLIIRKADISEIKSYLRKTDFQDMRYDGIKKVLRGLTTMEEINTVLSDKAK